MDHINEIIEESSLGYELAIQILEDEIRRFQWEMDAGLLDEKCWKKRELQHFQLKRIVKELKVNLDEEMDKEKFGRFGFRLTTKEE